MKRVGNNHGVSQKYSKMMQKRRLSTSRFQYAATLRLSRWPRLCCASAARRFCYDPTTVKKTRLRLVNAMEMQLQLRPCINLGDFALLYINLKFNWFMFS